MYSKAIGIGFHTKPSPTLGSLPAGLKHRVLQKCSVPFFFFFFVIPLLSASGQGFVFTYMVCLMQNAKNFRPKYRGTIIGIVDSMYGASAAIISAIYNSTFGKNDDTRKQNVAGFIFTLAALAAGVNLFVSVALRSLPWTEDDDKANRLDATTDGGHDSGAYYQSTGASVQHPTHDEEDGMHARKERLDASLTGELKHQYFTDTSEECDGSVSPMVAENQSPELNIFQLLRMVDFHLLFWAFIIATSVGLMFMNNIVFIMDSFPEKRLSHRYRKLFTTLLPVCSCVIRLTCGIVSDALASRVPRIFFVVAFLTPFTVAQILMCISPSSSAVLFANVVFVGSAFGCLWCLTPTILSEMGGLVNFGTSWGVVMLTSALGAVAYQAIYGKVYDSHAVVPPTVDPTKFPPVTTSDDRTCYGRDCYSVTFDAAAASCALALLLVTVLAVRTWRQKRKQR